MTSGFTILGLMVHRFRRAYLIFAAMLVVFVGLGQLPQSWIPEWAAGLLCLPFALGLLLTVFGFVNVEADISSNASAYSPWLLRLPVKTRELAIWPILAASIWGFVAWIIFAKGYLIPRGVQAPIVWPGFSLAALALSFQAIMWRPVRYGNVRLVVALVVGTAVSLFGLVSSLYKVSESLITLISALAIVVGAAAAWWSVAIARTTPVGGAIEPISIARKHVQYRPFRSPFMAQVWLEWRRQGRLLPILTTFGLLALSLPLAFNRSLDPVYVNSFFKVNLWVESAYYYIPWVPLVFATIIGMGAHKSDMRAENGSFNLFYATKPLNSNSMVRAKLMSIAIGVAITALITVGVLLGWLLIPCIAPSGKTVSYLSLLTQRFGRDEWIGITFYAALIICWCWRNEMVGAFTDYLPSRHYVSGYAFLIPFNGSIVLAVQSIPGFWSGDIGVIRMEIASGSLFLIKLVASVFSAREYVRLRPTGLADIRRILVWWLGIVLLVQGLNTWIIAQFSGNVTEIPLYMKQPICLFLTCLIVPITRPIYALSAIEKGRHRV